MPTAKTRDGNHIFYKDWGKGRPVILIHGYPLNADSFDRTAMKLAEAGYRVINYDRRGFGRSSQPWDGYDWDTYADDLADVMAATGATQDVTVIGYSMGGGECARYMSRHGGKGIRSLGLYASIVPGMFRSQSLFEDESLGWIVEGVGGHEAGDAGKTAGGDIETAGPLAQQAAPVAEPAEG